MRVEPAGDSADVSIVAVIDTCINDTIWIDDVPYGGEWTFEGDSCIQITATPPVYATQADTIITVIDTIYWPPGDTVIVRDTSIVNIPVLVARSVITWENICTGEGSGCVGYIADQDNIYESVCDSIMIATEGRHLRWTEWKTATGNGPGEKDTLVIKIDTLAHQISFQGYLFRDLNASYGYDSTGQWLRVNWYQNDMQHVWPIGRMTYVVGVSYVMWCQSKGSFWGGYQPISDPTTAAPGLLLKYAGTSVSTPITDYLGVAVRWITGDGTSVYRAPADPTWLSIYTTYLQDGSNPGSSPLYSPRDWQIRIPLDDSQTNTGIANITDSRVLISVVLHLWTIQWNGENTHP